MCLVKPGTVEYGPFGSTPRPAPLSHHPTPRISVHIFPGGGARVWCGNGTHKVKMSSVKLRFDGAVKRVSADALDDIDQFQALAWQVFPQLHGQRVVFEYVDDEG